MSNPDASQNPCHLGPNHAPADPQGASPDNILPRDCGDLLEGLNADDFEVDDFGNEVAEANNMGDEGPFFTPAESIPMTVGFKTGGGRIMAPPSAAALARVRKLFHEEEDLDSNKRQKMEPTSLFTTGSGAAVLPPSASALAKVSALFGDDAPEPSRTGFQTAAGTPVVPPSASSLAFANTLFDTSNTFTTGTGTPVAGPSQDKVAQAMALLDTPSAARPPFPPVRSFCPPTFTPSRTPLRPTTNTFASPRAKAIEIKTPAIRRIGLGGTPQSRKKGFVTPFKRGQLPRTMAGPTRQPERIFRPVFDLTVPADRKTLRQAFLKPQFYSVKELEEMGLPAEIWTLDLGNARYYRFLSDSGRLGTGDALEALRKDMCTLATARWVENHWEMILWKLAGEVQASPALFEATWTWDEVMRQLKYRYEREFGAAQRPLVRKIHEHDSSPSLPMVLCVAAVCIQETRPYLELTDGWYRIYAEVDDCLARAIEKGKIVAGRKLAIIGAKLDSGSDGADVLEAMDKSRLIISANSSALARWDARLGLQPRPFIAGLSSLSSDGGIIALVDVVVEKIFPLAYMNGAKGQRESPWDETEEQARQKQWLRRYSAESTRLQEGLRKNLERLENLLGLLQDAQTGGGIWERESSTDVEDDLDLLLADLNPYVRLRDMSNGQVSQLATSARQRMERELTDGQAEIEAELETICPKRDVRDFRMVRISDAQDGMKEPIRTALLNVWDAKGLEMVVRKRYLISNLTPGRGDWNRRPQPEKHEIYLNTRRDTRFKEL